MGYLMVVVVLLMCNVLEEKIVKSARIYYHLLVTPGTSHYLANSFLSPDSHLGHVNVSLFVFIHNQICSFTRYADLFVMDYCISHMPLV